MTASRTAGHRARRHVLHKRRSPPGAAPGTLVADPSAAGPVVVRMIGYGPDTLDERPITEIEALSPMLDRYSVAWINVDGLADLELIRRLGDLFGLHRLALEDVVNVHQRPKVEDYEDHVFIVTRMIDGRRMPMTEQVSMFLGTGFVLTFQERPGDCFEPVRERIRKRRGLIRERKADYLAYALLDVVIDGYFPVLETYGERLEILEDAVMARPSPDHVAQIHEMKRDLLTLRRAIWPFRELVYALTRDSSPRFTDLTRVYLQDCYDHTVQLMDIVETYREIASGLVDVYLSSTSARMNDIMKVLTVIATIFMPLGFIAGVYGMNFDRGVSPWNMPELGWSLGYPFALLLMATVAGALVAYFRWRRWIGGRIDRRSRNPDSS